MTMFCYAAKIPKANQIGFGVGRLKCKVPQRDVRLFLVLINLIVLVSAVASFTAARCSETSVHTHHLKMTTDMEPISMQDGVTMKKYLTISQQELSSAIHNHMEAILYITSFNLLLYWLIYGVAVAYKLGGMCEMCILIVSIPHTVVMVVWELGLATFFVKIEQVGFYATWAPTLATILIITCLVQLGTAALLALMAGTTTSGFQNMSGVFTIGRHLQRNGELPLTIEQTLHVEPGRSEAPLDTGRYTHQPEDRTRSSATERLTHQAGDRERSSVTERHTHQAGDRERSSVTERLTHQSGDRDRSSATERLGFREQSLTTGQHSQKPVSIRHINNPEYVEFNPFESSLYLTEMPEQILSRERSGCVAGQEESSIRTGQGALDTMTQVYNKSSNKAVDTTTQVNGKNGEKAGTCGDSRPPSYGKAKDVLPGVYLTCSDRDYIDSNFVEDYMYMKGEIPQQS